MALPCKGKNLKAGQDFLERVASDLAKTGERTFEVCKNWRAVDKGNIMEKWSGGVSKGGADPKVRGGIG